MTKDEYFDSILNDDRLVMNCAEARFYCNDGEECEGEIDVITRLAYEFSLRIRTPQHLSRARWFMRAFSDAALEFNICEGEGDCRELLDMPEPEIDATDVSIAVC